MRCIRDKPTGDTATRMRVRITMNGSRTDFVKNPDSNSVTKYLQGTLIRYRVNSKQHCEESCKGMDRELKKKSAKFCKSAKFRDELLRGCIIPCPGGLHRKIKLLSLKSL